LFPLLVLASCLCPNISVENNISKIEGSWAYRLAGCDTASLVVVHPFGTDASPLQWGGGISWGLAGREKEPLYAGLHHVLALKLQAECYSETSICTYRTACSHIREEYVLKTTGVDASCNTSLSRQVTALGTASLCSRAAFFTGTTLESVCSPIYRSSIPLSVIHITYAEMFYLILLSS
jgi:hypothetical protein